MTNETMNFRYNAQKIMLKRDDIIRSRVLTVVLLKIQVCWNVHHDTEQAVSNVWKVCSAF